MSEEKLIEADEFPFEFLSQLAERESWRKEIHRPIYHVHKWWAKRLGSVFRGILLGSILPQDADLRTDFYRCHNHNDLAVFDPFMGSGTTVGEAHKLGMTALGRDINSVAVEAVKTALGPLDRRKLCAAMDELSATVGDRIGALFQSVDAQGRRCDVLYFFWVMQANCPECEQPVDLFPSYVIARNAYPRRKPQIQIVCPSCAEIFEGVTTDPEVQCPHCQRQFDVREGPAQGKQANCGRCRHEFSIIDAVRRAATRPRYRLVGKLVLTAKGNKQYLAATPSDHALYQSCSTLLDAELKQGRIRLPELSLAQGHNTRQAMNYGFSRWRDFFNDRQLLALGWLQAGISALPDEHTRRALLTLFSGVLEFNNYFASYKGEGTGAVRHMLSHHILKPERMPIEAHVWGTAKSSGSFTNLFRSRLLRAIEYREAPCEIFGQAGPSRICSPAFAGRIEKQWPTNGPLRPAAIYLSSGDSATTKLPGGSIDLVVTDPPFFDNVHYSELADFFFAWQQLHAASAPSGRQSTRDPGEVQDTDVARFSEKLRDVLRECHRVLKDDGLLVFTYHHSKDDGWTSLADAIGGAGFVVQNAHPVRAEMSIATPKSQAKEPIQLDMVIVCRKRDNCSRKARPSLDTAMTAAGAKLQRLEQIGLALSKNDRKIVYFGQALTAIDSSAELTCAANRIEVALKLPQLRSTVSRVRKSSQALLFGDT